MKNPHQETHHKYHHLKTVIAKRQAFEKKPKNRISPWINHPTTANFFDVRGNTLLIYACQLGDAKGVEQLVQDPAVNIEQIQLFKKGGPTPIEIALQEGHLKIAKILFKKGAKCSHILLANLHPNCKAWFKEKIMESFNLSWSTRDTDTAFKKPSPFFEKEWDEMMDRLIEINDMESIKKRYMHNRVSLYLGDISKSSTQKYLCIAAANGYKDLVDFFLAKNSSLHPENFAFEQTPLHAAVEGHQLEIAKYLLQLNAPVNCQNNKKKTPLMLAVEANDVNLVKLLLDNHADVRIKDAHGDNVLHKAVAKNNPEIMKLLFNHKHQKFLLEDKNIYGFSSQDMAISEANDTLLALIYSHKQLDVIKKSPLYGNKKIPINHGYLLPILHYYLTLDYRDTDFLTIHGHCYGFSFLRDYFTSLEKNSYFYQVLQSISRWDGNPAALLKAFPEGSPQASFYANPGALLEHWTTWIIWLQSGDVTETTMSLKQKQIEEKFALIAPANTDFSLITTFKMPDWNLTREQLEEYVWLIKKMPETMMFNLTGGAHSTSGNVTRNKLYLDYYDSNFLFKPDPEQLKKYVIDILLDVKYYAIDKLIENKFPASFHIFYFNHQAVKLNNFLLFSPNELPKSKTQAEEYRERSPNKFTHLHAALITGSYLNLEQLLQEKYCDPTMKNSFGCTILDMALYCENIPFISLILKYSTCGVDIASTIQRLPTSENGKRIKAILMQYLRPADLIKLCIEQIDCNNMAYVENFVREHKDILNVTTKEGRSLLLAAVEANRDLIMDILIKNGASVTKKAMSKYGVFLESGPISPLDEIINKNATQHFAMVLNCSMEIHALLDNFHNNHFKKAQNLLEAIQFDFNNKIHKMIMEKLLSQSWKKDTDCLVALIQKLDSKMLNALYDDGKPLIINAVIENNFSAFKALIAQGACINNQTEPGKNTALHAILRLNRGHEWCQLLLDQGAKTDIKNKEGVTAAHLAKEASPEIQALILPAEYRPTLF